MTKIQEYLAALPEDKKALFIPVFGSVDKFYTVVYMIIRNEHVTDQEKPERYEDRLQVIRQVKNKVEELVSSYHLPKEHKDPFDRIMIWQAIKNNMVFLSVDSKMEKYAEYGLKLF